MLNKTIYCFNTAIQNFRKNLLLNLITSTTITIALIIFTMFLIVFMNISAFKKGWVDQLHIITFLKDSLHADSIDQLKDEISQYDEVDKITFVSRDEALKTLKGLLEGQDGILEGLEENPLSPSFEIKLKKEFITLEGVERFVGKIKNNKHIDDIEYGQKWLERFSTFFQIIKITGFGFGGFLFILTLFIISNSIKLMVFSRREEIEVMKLIGATERFIKVPFYIEGVIQGLIGAVASVIFVFVTVNIGMGGFISSLDVYIGTSNFVTLNPPLTFSVVFLGVVLGFTGSLISLSSIKELKN